RRPGRHLARPGQDPPQRAGLPGQALPCRRLREAMAGAARCARLRFGNSKTGRLAMRRRTFNKLLGAGVAAAALGKAGLGRPPAPLARAGLGRAADTYAAGFIYVGPVADYGFSHQHDLGRQAAQKALGDKVKTTYVESVKEGPDAERVIREMATAGNGIIFTTSFGFMNPTIKVAKQFPKVKFEHATGYKRADNVATYNIRFYEGRYVQGVIAGK